MANDNSGTNINRPGQSGRQNVSRLNEKNDNTGKNDQSCPAGHDRDSLARTAARLKDLERRLSERAPVDTRRVNDVKNAIASGEYRIDAKRIADKIINLEASFDD
jgi:negative regulator of flagellin synthesis FlgM